MNNFQASASQTGNNRNVWIILGSVIGVLVIVTGGCVACGVMIGLSNLSSGGSNFGESGHVGVIASNSFSGTMNCDDGDTLPFSIKFSESGYWLYHYETSRGGREEELKSSGPH